MDHEGRVAQIAAAVLDGTPVDWAAAESQVDGAGLRLVRHLRSVAALADVHRRLTPRPECWGHLRLIEAIGRGTFGEVYRAWDTRLNREVALKLLPADSVAGDRAASSIIGEGRLLARVRHPNVATIYGAEQIGDRIGLSMEFVRGRTLEQMLQQGTVFNATEAVRIGRDLCSAVSAVHAADLLHRDIKAHNVMVADDGRVVLMDFGTGRALDDSSSCDLTGTPLYVAPEVLDGQPATAQSDIYSLGVLLHHIVTGSYPVSGQTIRDIRLAHDRNERTDVRTARPGVPPALARVIKRAIDPLPERRYETVDAVARDLAALQARPGVRLTYGLAAVAAVFLVAFGVSELWARQPVIGVMPFKNLGSTPGDDLGGSLAAGLIQQLANIEGLQVISRTSSFQLRGQPLDLVGKRLGVNYVVDGDAALSAGTLVIHAELLPVAGGAPVWKGTLQKEVSSAGALADALAEITTTIVKNLRLNLGPTRQRYYPPLPTFQKYWRATKLREARGWRGSDSVALFKDVIHEDPSFAPAHAALAATYGDMGLKYPARNLSSSAPAANDYSIPPDEAAALMRPLAERALEMDLALAEAHAAMGFTYALEHRWVDAERSFRHAINLDATIPAAYGDFVYSTLLPQGRLNDALNTLEAGLRVDPLSLDLRRTLAHIQLLAGRYDHALRNCQRVVDADPDFPFAELFCIRTLIVQGRTTDALDRLNKHPELQFLSYFHAITGQRAEAEAAAASLAQLPYRQVFIYTGLGEIGRAVEAFERFAALNPIRAAQVLSDPELAALRSHPRIEAFRRTMGFPK